MPDLTPMTREEKFLNGDTDLTPITRREHFYAGRESELPEGHQEPETREEWFIKEYREAGDVTVEEITITENGTTTAPSGKAYSPIHTNVPLPSNAYLLKSVNTPTPIASFSDGEDMVMPSLKVAIEPQQEGSGDPSPTNIRPISGWSGANVTRTGKNLFDMSMTLENGFIDASGQVVIANQYKHTQLIKIKPNTSYVGSGYLSSGSGYLTTVAYYDKNRNFISQATMSAVTPYPMTPPQNASYLILSGNAPQVDTIQLEEGTTATTYEPYNGHTYTIDLDGTRYGGEVDVVNGIVTPAPYYASYNGETLTGEWISDRDKYEVGATPTIGAQVVNIGASGTPVSILPTAVKSLLGQNNIWADTGDITDAEYFSKEV